MLNAYKDATQAICEQKGWDKSSIEQIWLFLSEEFGELASSIRRFSNQYKDKKKVKIEDEMGDVFSYLFQLAYMLNVDLDNMWKNNVIKAKKKRKWGNNRVNDDKEHSDGVQNDNDKEDGDTDIHSLDSDDDNDNEERKSTSGEEEEEEDEEEDLSVGTV